MLIMIGSAIIEGLGIIIAIVVVLLFFYGLYCEIKSSYVERTLENRFNKYRIYFNKRSKKYAAKVKVIWFLPYLWYGSKYGLSYSDFVLGEFKCLSDLIKKLDRGHIEYMQRMQRDEALRESYKKLPDKYERYK